MENYHYKNPIPTVDIVIYNEQKGVVLVQRKNPPFGWALPGGFIEYGESAEAAAVREAKEETALDVSLGRLLGVYSEPDRDPRQHALSIVFVAEAKNVDAIQGGNDASEAKFFSLNELPPLVFDHATIIEDFKALLKAKK